MSLGGLLRHKSCIHHVPNGATVGPDWTVYDSTGTVLQQIVPCGYPTYKISDTVTAGTSGWVAYAEQGVPSSSSSWTLIAGDVEVPATPSDTSANISYWNGLEPGDAGNQVLQPAIVWGPNWYYGSSSNRWSEIAVNQFADTSDEINSDMTEVSTNDLVVLEVYLDSISAADTCAWNMTSSGWEYRCGYQWAYVVLAYDTNTGAEESITVYQSSTGEDTPPEGVLFPNAYPAVYESYGDTTCEDGAIFENNGLYSNDSTNLLDENVQNFGPGGGAAGGGVSPCSYGFWTYGTSSPPNNIWIY
jgi:hypothetical protein